MDWFEINEQYNIDEYDAEPITEYEDPTHDSFKILLFVTGSDEDGWIIVGVECRTKLRGDGKYMGTEMAAGPNGGVEIYTTRDEAIKAAHQSVADWSGKSLEGLVG